MPVINTLGPLTVLDRGAPIHLRPAQRRLLSILLLDPRRALAADQLIDRMWGEQPPKSARAALQVHMSGLRKVLARVIETTPDGYRIDTTRIRLDQTEFIRLVSSLERARDQEDWEAVTAAAAEALGLWRGSPYPELAGDGFAVADLVRLGELHLEAAVFEVEALLALGHNDLALPRLRSLIGEHPLNERVRRLLMLALYRAGRQGEALREYQSFRRYLGDALGIEPGEVLRELEEQILLQSPAIGASSVLASPHSLPPTTTSFVGRENDIRLITKNLAEDRLVTIAGGPGYGKTRLSVELGRMVLDNYPGGVWFADLTGAHDPLTLAATVATATGSSEQVMSLEQLAETIRPRPLLLIIDSCEHLLEPVRRLVVAMISEPGESRVLATSRRPLSIAGEQIHRLEPLDLSGDDPVALLVDRIRITDRAFTLNAGNRSAVDEVCAAVDGVPLAIELVAKGAATLGLHDTARLLASVTSDSALDGAFEWSARLLPEGDRNLLARLSILSAPFTLDRAQEVTGATKDVMAVAGSISRLVEASLIKVEWSGASARYRMLQPIREMAAARLTSAESQDVEQRRAGSFQKSAIEIGRDSIGPGQSTVFATLDVEVADYRETMAWLRSVEDWAGLIRVTDSLSLYWYARFLAWEGRHWLGDIPEGTLDDADMITFLRVSGFLAWAVHDYEQADRFYLGMMESARRSGDLRATADALYGRGIIHQKRRFIDGAAMIEQAASIYQSIDGCDLELGQCLLFRGLDEASSGEVDRGAEMLERAVSLLESVGHSRQVSKAERWLAHCAWRRADEAAARVHADRAEAIARSIGDHIALGGALVEKARIETEWGVAGQAAGYLLEALLPIPTDDEVDMSQVLLPVAGLAQLNGESELAAAILRHIDDVYEKNGWRPLDTTVSGARVRASVGATAPAQGDLTALVRGFLDRIATG